VIAGRLSEGRLADNDRLRLRENCGLIDKEAQGEVDAVHDHPFPNVARQIVLLTGWQCRDSWNIETQQSDAFRDVMRAAWLEFAGYEQLMTMLWQAHDAGRLDLLYAALINQHPTIAARVGLRRAAKPKGTKRVSQAKLAEAHVLAWVLRNPNHTASSKEIGDEVGIEERIVRKTNAWKSYARQARTESSAGDAGDLGEIDQALEEVAGKQQRGRNSRLKAR